MARSKPPNSGHVPKRKGKFVGPPLKKGYQRNPKTGKVEKKPKK